MTLLSLIRDVCDDTGIARPSTVIGSTDLTARRLLRLANKGGELLAQRAPWTLLQREHTFSLVSGTAAYALPSDYDRLIDDTLWDRTQYWALRGPLSASEWQVVKSGVAASGPRLRWRIKGSSATRFYLDPTPGADNNGDTVVIEYLSTSWCQSSGGTGQSAWAADTDTGVLPESLLALDLTWRWKESKGDAYAEAKLEFETACDRRIAQDGGAPTLCLAQTPLPFLGNGNVPDTGFG